MVMIARSVPYDVWLEITGLLDSPRDLVSCARTNWLLHDAAIPALYRAIDIKHITEGSVAKLAQPNVFDTLNEHPELRYHVRSVYHSVHIAPDSLASVESDVMLAKELSALPNLASYTIRSPWGQAIPLLVTAYIVENLTKHTGFLELECDFDVHWSHLGLLRRLPSIRSLHFHSITDKATQELHSFLLSFPELRYLSLERSGGFDISLSRDLVDNGSLVHLTSLAIGRSHSLSPRELLSLFTFSPNLHSLDIFYDNFVFTHNTAGFTELYNPGNVALPNLERLKVKHQGVAGRQAFHNFFAWVNKLSAKSPLEHLSIDSDDDKIHDCGSCTGASAPKCLVAIMQQHPRLVTLSHPHISLAPSVTDLISTVCPQLEKLVFSARPPRPGAKNAVYSRPAVSGFSIVRMVKSRLGGGAVHARRNHLWPLATI